MRKRFMSDANLTRILLLFALLLSAVQGYSGEASTPSGRGAVYSNGLPDYYPSRFDQKGILQKLNSRGYRLIINATAYTLAPNVRVHTLETQFGTIHSLCENLPIGFNLRSNVNGKRKITEIWVLPNGAVKLD
jgi:hypothetical protein